MLLKRKYNVIIHSSPKKANCNGNDVTSNLPTLNIDNETMTRRCLKVLPLLNNTIIGRITLTVK